jgi:hypothetical protein
VSISSALTSGFVCGDRLDLRTRQAQCRRLWPTCARCGPGPERPRSRSCMALGAWRATSSIWSAHDEQAVEALKAVARRRLAPRGGGAGAKSRPQGVKIKAHRRTLGHGGVPVLGIYRYLSWVCAPSVDSGSPARPYGVPELGCVERADGPRQRPARHDRRLCHWSQPALVSFCGSNSTRPTISRLIAHSTRPTTSSAPAV